MKAVQGVRTGRAAGLKPVSRAEPWGNLRALVSRMIPAHGCCLPRSGGRRCGRSRPSPSSSRGRSGCSPSLNPTLGEHFGALARAGLLDLSARPRKGRGAFCSPLLHRRQANIFMSTTGADRDQTSLAHEAGHAFAMIEAGRSLPLLFQHDVGNEIGEMAAMAMELLVTPFLHRAHGGFYDDEDHRWSFAVQLERIVDALPRIAAIDAMQHWVYTDPAGSDRDSREQQWLELCGRFMRGADWSGLQDYLIARWHTHAHFFLYPFTTSSTGSGRSPPCRSGATACTTGRVPCATTGVRSRSATPERFWRSTASPAPA